jgi:hypothetical protein
MPGKCRENDRKSSEKPKKIPGKTSEKSQENLRRTSGESQGQF